MPILANILVSIVALLHLWFLALEMFLWQKPLGLKVFRMSQEKAEMTAVLAGNQGLYNGFLAAGLFTSFATGSSDVAFAFRIFFLICVIIAGLYGAVTVSRKILYVQTVPAALALAMVWISH